MENINQRDLMTVQEFADECGCSAACVRGWIKEGFISAVKVGKKFVRIPISELNRIIDEGYRGGEDGE
jgi:excisionase family DNA binding protein